MNAAVLTSNFHYLEHLETALGMLAFKTRGKWWHIWCVWVPLCPESCADRIGSERAVEYYEEVGESSRVRVDVPESHCVSRVVLIQPEVLVMSNTTRQWGIVEGLTSKFHYLEHRNTALRMLAFTMCGKRWHSWCGRVPLCSYCCADKTGSTQCEGEEYGSVDEMSR